jgi:FKBP-type peptidyl-prolyl cis-trans isomerase SlyD
LNIRHGTLVQLDYKLYGPEGELVDESELGAPMEYLHGHGEVPEALERALEGLQPGATKRVELAPGEAYGPHDPEGIIAVPRESFPPDREIVPGDVVAVQVQDEEGRDLPGESIDMRVVEISPEAIVLDANHPLAGRGVAFEVAILAVRMLDKAEIAARQAEDDEDE